MITIKKFILPLLVFTILLISTVLTGCKAEKGVLSADDAVTGENGKTDAGDILIGSEDDQDLDSEDQGNKDHDNKDEYQEGAAAGNADNDSKSLLAAQREYIREGKDPVELKAWMDSIMDDLSEEDATIMVANFEEYLSDSRQHYETLLPQDGYEELLQNVYDGTLKRGNIKVSNDELRSLLDKMYEAGYKLKMSEGYFFPVVDYAYLTQYKGWVSEELYDYFNTMALESEQSFASDAGLIITWDELASRINTYEAFLAKYPGSKYRGEIQRYLLYYTEAYLFGLDNTPVFDFESDEIKEDVQKSYKDSLKAYPNTELSKLLDEHIKLLEAEGFKQTAKTASYRDEIRAALRRKLENKVCRYYEIVIEGTKLEHEKHNINYPVLKGMEDENLQAEINKKLYDSISALLVEEAEGQYNSTNWVDYQVQRFDGDILSVTFDVSTYFEGAAHPIYTLISTNIDLKTGEKYSLDQLFKDGFDYKKYLTEESEAQIAVLDVDLIEEFKGIDELQEFYLTPYHLVIYYQPYVYTSHAYGPLKLYFSYAELKQQLAVTG